MNGQHKFRFNADSGDIGDSEVVATSAHEHGPDEQQGLIDGFWKDTDVIYTYTRAQAIEDGVLVDVSEMAKEAGFIYPVAVTSRVWHEVVVPDDRARPWGQSEEGRLWDVLQVLRFTIKRLRSGDSAQEIPYQVSVIMKERQRRTVTLKAHCGPGDTLEPVITIMFPDED